MHSRQLTRGKSRRGNLRGARLSTGYQWTLKNVVSKGKPGPWVMMSLHGGIWAIFGSMPEQPRLVLPSLHCSTFDQYKFVLGAPSTISSGVGRGGIIAAKR
jgi:hypothetical protein